MDHLLNSPGLWPMDVLDLSTFPSSLLSVPTFKLFTSLVPFMLCRTRGRLTGPGHLNHDSCFVAYHAPDVVAIYGV